MAISIKPPDVFALTEGLDPIAILRRRRRWRYDSSLKRLLDILLSLAGIAFGLPVFIAIAIAIKLDSPGPVIFAQERVGRGGRTFRCYKFRSMRRNAEEQLADLRAHNEADGPVFKIRNDPRITRLGGFLRRSSLDELPQLFNVLTGDMSLVGPRPPLPTEVAMYSQSDRARLAVKPGLTCIWQISGRSDISFERWIELDREYIANLSLWLDLRILFRTVLVVLLARGAY